MRPPDQHTQMQCRAFTLVELLLCISLIGLLVALLVPSLQNVRESSLKAKSLVLVRGHVTAMTLYTGDWSETYLNMIDPLADYGVIRWDGFAQRIVYFQQVHYWHFGMARRYYSGNIFSDAFCVPGAPLNLCATQHHLGPAGYWYTATVLAAPEYWNQRTRQGRAQWRSIRSHEVLFPSQKGLFIGGWPMMFGNLAPNWRAGSDVGFVDGHADRVTPGRYLDPDPGGDGQFYLQSMPVVHTKDGIRGRDVR